MSTQEQRAARNATPFQKGPVFTGDFDRLGEVELTISGTTEVSGDIRWDGRDLNGNIFVIVESTEVTSGLASLLVQERPLYPKQSGTIGVDEAGDTEIDLFTGLDLSTLGYSSFMDLTSEVGLAFDAKKALSPWGIRFYATGVGGDDGKVKITVYGN